MSAVAELLVLFSLCVDLTAYVKTVSRDCCVAWKLTNVHQVRVNTVPPATTDWLTMTVSVHLDIQVCHFVPSEIP